MGKSRLINAYLAITANNTLEAATLCVGIQINAGEGNVAETSI